MESEEILGPQFTGSGSTCSLIPGKRFPITQCREDVMDMRPRFRISLAAAAALIAAWTSLVLGAMPVPGTSQMVEYEALKLPLLSDDPSQARPVTVGKVAEGGDNFNLHIGLHECDDPVDVYLGLQASFVPGELFMFTSDGGLYPVSQAGILPWKVEVSVPVEENFFEGGIPVAALPPGVYTLYLAVTPANSLEAVYLWVTSFLVPGLSLQEVEAGIIGTLGQDQGFQALWLALDKGYSLEQIVAASMAGHLRGNGAIYGFLEGLIEPAGPSPDIFTGLELEEVETMALLLKIEDPTGDELARILALIERIKTAVGKADTLEKRADLNNLSLVLSLLVTGYSPRQIAEHLVVYGKDGVYWIMVESLQKIVPVLRYPDNEKSVIAPAGPIGQICNLKKSLSPMKVELSADATVKHKAVVSARSLDLERSFTALVTDGTGPFDFYFYWGDLPPPELFANVLGSSQSAEHSFTEPKTYQLIARVVDRSNGTHANSSPLDIQIEPGPAYACWVGLEHVSATYMYADPNLPPVIYGDSYSFVARGTLDGTQLTGSIDDSAYTPADDTFTGHLNMRIDPDSLTASDIDASLSHSRGGVTLRAMTGGHDSIPLERDQFTEIISGRSEEGTAACRLIDSLVASRPTEGLTWVGYDCNEFTYLSISCQEQ